MQDNDLKSDLRSRVQDRLSELGRSPITAAQNVGLERTYIRDFINGKKDSIRSDKYSLVAAALEWTVPQLLGTAEPLVSTTLATRLRRAREVAGHTQVTFSQESGLPTGALNAWEVGEGLPNAQQVRSIAKLLGVSYDWLATGEGDGPIIRFARGPGAYPPRAEIPGDQLVGARDFPIYAAAQGGEGFMIVHTEVMEYVKRPVILEGVPDSYGVLVVGESMIPAYRPGDMALVHPRRPVERDSDVILYDHDHRTGDAKSMIKHLLSFNDRSYKLEQYNPAKTFTEHKADWPICHQVVGMYKGRR